MCCAKNTIDVLNINPRRNNTLNHYHKILAKYYNLKTNFKERDLRVCVDWTSTACRQIGPELKTTLNHLHYYEPVTKELNESGIKEPNLQVKKDESNTHEFVIRISL